MTDVRTGILAPTSYIQPGLEGIFKIKEASDNNYLCFKEDIDCLLDGLSTASHIFMVPSRQLNSYVFFLMAINYQNSYEMFSLSRLMNV